MSAASPPTAPLIRDISDTALWAANYRAQESVRPDALFRDPLAQRLAGERGRQIAEETPKSARHAWAWVTRTWLFDQFLRDQIAAGADMVVNLAAGLDARPYRMELPRTLQWIEVDLPPLLASKEETLRGEQPRCALERVPLDLADRPARRALFESLGRRAKKALIVSEGLLIYLAPDAVGELARDLAEQASFQRWVIDIASPGLMRMLQKQLGSRLEGANAPFKFAPAEGPGFFEPYGWKATDVRSMLRTAARLRRVPFFFRLLAKLPEPRGRQGNRPWSAVCLLERA